MILFFSDTHFGRDDRQTERKLEGQVIEMLSHYQSELTHVYLVGDIFDEYIEYKNLVPKGFVRFQAKLAELTDNGIQITYLVGNHDPWHNDYYQKELGVKVEFDDVIVNHFDRQIYISHGDGHLPSSKKYNLLKPVLRHPFPVWIYKNLLPGNLGYVLARWYNRKFGSHEIKGHQKTEMREFASQVLKDTPAEIALMGHTHQAEFVQETGANNSVYINLGFWRGEQTYSLLTKNEIKLVKWNNGNCEIVSQSFLDDSIIKL